VNTRARRTLRIIGLSLLALVGVVVTIGVLAQRDKGELAPWHTERLETEFRARMARDGDFDWADYLQLEERLFRELDEQLVDPSGELANPHWGRFAPAGTSNPANFPRNWNRSFEFESASPIGAVLLLHGLTDSPYSLRRTGEILHERGYHVLGLRLPGHGTAPSELRDASLKDWRAAIRIAAAHLQEVLGEGGELLLAGYSNGGALAIDYTIDSLDDESLRVPDRLILFSPAIGVSRMAVLARAHHVLSFMPYFKKLEWGGIMPEYDPYKYNSFPTDAGYETHLLTGSVRKRLAQLQQRGASADFPPVLSFMSLADATVKVEAVVSALYDRLARPENELVIFDVNRRSTMRDFFRLDPAVRLQELKDRPTTPYRLTVLSNRDDQSDSVLVGTRAAGATEFEESDPGLEWPRGIYSLSHVATPFPQDDPVYGLVPPPEGALDLPLGRLEPRGERGLLSVPVTHLTRLRSNPFFPYVERRLAELGAP